METVGIDSTFGPLGYFSFPIASDNFGIWSLVVLVRMADLLLIWLDLLTGLFEHIMTM